MLTPPQIKSFLKFLWTRRLYHSDALVAQDGRPVEVIVSGEADPEGGDDMLGAHVVLGGVSCMGPVAVCHRASDLYRYNPRLSVRYDSLVLLVVAVPDTVACRTDGSVIPTLAITWPEELGEMYRRLVEGSVDFGCGEYFASLKPVSRYEILTRLTIERLERKYNDFLEVYRESDCDWNQAFYIMLFRAMNTGSKQNQAAYIKLARTVPYHVLSRVRESILSVEALLLGGAGLLETRYIDDYTIELQREFAHLSRRFGIAPMWPREWVLSGRNPNNHPVVRLVELAALLSTEEFLFSRLIECRTPDDIRTVLSAEASEYWTTHYLPGRRGGNTPKQIGSMTMDILGINLVAPMMFTYGNTSFDEELKERAVAMLEMIPAENNRYLRRWSSRGVNVENAFFSQGLLQLSLEYCEKKRCAECNIGKILLCSR